MDGAGASPFRLGHRPALDGLRGIAVLLVLASHLVPPLLHGGFVGVDLFFVLSGFLITTLLVEEWKMTGRIHLGYFYQRRFLRLFPALLALQLGLLAYFVSSPNHRLLTWENLKTIVVSAFYLMNWFTALGAIQFNLLSHTWSLANEEQYYLFWPPLLLGLLRAGLRRGMIIVFLLLGILGSAMYRAFHWFGHHDALRLFYTIDARLDGLLLGSLLGLLVSWNGIPRSPAGRRTSAATAAAGAAYLAWFAWHGQWSPDAYYTGEMLVINIAAAALLLEALNDRALLARILNARILRWFGKISYGLYLWHYPVIWIVMRSPIAKTLKSLTAVAASIAIATISHYFLEQPLLKFKRRSAAA